MQLKAGLMDKIITVILRRVFIKHPCDLIEEYDLLIVVVFIMCTTQFRLKSKGLVKIKIHIGISIVTKYTITFCA